MLFKIDNELYKVDGDSESAKKTLEIISMTLKFSIIENNKNYGFHPAEGMTHEQKVNIYKQILLKKDNLVLYPEDEKDIIVL